MSIAIKVENLSKIYRLGEIGTGTISRDLERWWATKVLKKEDPFLKIGEANDRAHRGQSDIVYSLRNINFEIQQGEAVGIIGKNGAGKSTLLKILSRVTSPSTGFVKVKGRVVSLLEVGTGFHPELTGRENIYLNGAILGMRKTEINRKLEEIVDFSGVERYIDTPVKRYSSGMYVRLAFAVAAHLESEILIVDEVLAVGDVEFQKKCLGKMGEVSQSDGRTILFVSHNMVAIQNLCKKGMLLGNGEIEYMGEMYHVVNQYLETNVRSKENEMIISLENSLRTKGFGIVIKKVWIENCNGEVVRKIEMGSGFSIKFQFISTQPLRNVLFGFGIEDNQGQRITSLNNEIAGGYIAPEISEGVAELKLFSPNLMYGLYFVSISIVTNQSEWVDFIEQAINFEIIEKDVYNSGKIIDRSQGMIFLNGEVNTLKL
jgi:lipopolysaccharide transport system ATP-binding protein